MNGEIRLRPLQTKAVPFDAFAVVNNVGCSVVVLVEPKIQFACLDEEKIKQIESRTALNNP